MAKANKVKLPDGTYVSLNDERIHIYRSLTGTAADTVSPYCHAKWDVTDDTITQYVDGMAVCIKVPVAGNGTYGTALQINSLGYKPVVYNVNSMVSTRYGVGAVVWAVYNATQTASLYVNSDSASTITGCWQVQDYDANTNTIGYQLRTNSSTRPVSSATYRYRLMFSSLDNSKWVPATNSTSTNATSARTVNQEVINPWGRIVYYSTTAAKTAGQTISATAQWDRYIFNLGYSFNTGAALDLTFPGPVYIRCTPQAGGGAIIDSSTPYVQTLPSTADGKIYIYLGQAYSASEVELIDYHPVFYHDGTKIALWTDTKGFSGDYNDLTNKPTIPDVVSGVNDGTNWTSITIGNTTKAIPQGGSSTLSGLSDTTISSPADKQVLTYDDATSKWVNSDIPKEVFLCTFTTTIDYDNNNEVTFSCDKTPAEIYAAYEAGKCVILKTAGANSDEQYVPETSAVYYLESALMYDTEPVRYQLFFQCDISQIGTVFKVIAGQNGFHFALIPQNIIFYISGFSDMYGISDGWHFEREMFKFARLQSGASSNHLVVTDGTLSNIKESDISSSDVSTAISNSHTHSNKTVLDYIPSSLGTAGQVLRVNSGATGLEFGTVSGGLTNYDFTHTANTTISSSTTTVTFAANTRGSAMLTISADLGLTVACNNGSDNYIWIKNTGSSDVDVTISGVTQNSTNVSNVYMPSDGISVPAGGLCEIGVIVNSDGAFITTRNDLAL